jgi:hypothetical protein
MGFHKACHAKGNPYDNDVAENFFSCLKCECIYLNHFVTRSQAQNEIFRYIEAFYNLVSLHSAIAWMAPNDFEYLISMSSNDTCLIYLVLFVFSLFFCTLNWESLTGKASVYNFPLKSTKIFVNTISNSCYKF